MKQFKWHIGTIAFVYALSNVFIQPYTAYLGLDANLYSIFQTLNILVLASSQFIFGYLCDRYQTIQKFLRRMIIIVICLALVIFVGQVFFKMPTKVVLLLLLCLQLFQGPLFTLSETWIMLSPKRLSLFFGNIRMYASLTWAISCLVFGIVLMGDNIQFLPLLVAVFYLFPLFIHSRLHDVVTREVSLSEKTGYSLEVTSSEKRSLLLFGVFSVAAFFFFISGRYFTFIGFIFKASGIEQQQLSLYIGITVFLMALSELPLFLYGKKAMLTYGANRMFSAAVVTSIVRVLIMWFFPHPIVYIMCGVLQGIIYPAYLLSLRHISKALVSERIFNTVFGLFTLVITMGDMFLTFFLGPIVKANQMSVVYMVCLSSGILSLCIFTGFRMLQQRDTKI